MILRYQSFQLNTYLYKILMKWEKGMFFLFFSTLFFLIPFMTSQLKRQKQTKFYININIKLYPLPKPKKSEWLSEVMLVSGEMVKKLLNIWYNTILMSLLLVEILLMMMECEAATTAGIISIKYSNNFMTK